MSLYNKCISIGTFTSPVAVTAADTFWMFDAATSTNLIEVTIITNSIITVHQNAIINIM